jgi:putative phosphoesterase
MSAFRIAAFSDIHGNLPALQVVLEDIDQQGVDLVVCPGDLVGYGPYPNEVVELIRRKGICTVQGNYDDGVGYDRDGCGCAYRTPIEKETGAKSLKWTQGEVSERNKTLLRVLPNQATWEKEGMKVLMVHGSPRRINEYLYEDRPESSVRRMLEPLEVDVVIFGHTHQPYHRIVSGIHMVNDGSVGRPKDGDNRASYAIIELGIKAVNVEFRRVSYPVQIVIDAMLEKGLPEWLGEYLLKAGKMD